MRACFYLLVLLILPACTHFAPDERVSYNPSQSGFIQAVQDIETGVVDPKARLFIVANASADAKPILSGLTFVRPKVDAAEPVADQLYIHSCRQPCPDILSARSAWLLDSESSTVKPVAVEVDGIKQALQLVRETENASLALEFGSEPIIEESRYEWSRARGDYAVLDDYVCSFATSSHPSPDCFSRTRLRSIAVVSSEMTYQILEPTKENILRIPELSKTAPGSIVMLEMLGLALGDTMTGQVLFIETLDNEKFCGVIGEPKRPQVTCVEFSALKDVYVRIKGRGEPWGLEDYAFLPLRVAAGIGTATVIAGGGS